MSDHGSRLKKLRKRLQAAQTGMSGQRLLAAVISHIGGQPTALSRTMLQAPADQPFNGGNLHSMLQAFQVGVEKFGNPNVQPSQWPCCGANNAYGHYRSCERATHEQALAKAEALKQAENAAAERSVQ
jgi:hypothetical protein